MENPVQITEAPLEKIQCNVNFLREVPRNAQFIACGLVQVCRIDGGSFRIDFGTVHNGIHQMANLSPGPVDFLRDAAVASGLALEHPSALVESGEGLSLLEVDREPLKAGFDDGKGAVHSGVSRTSGIVCSLIVHSGGAVHLVQRLFEGSQVPGSGFRAAGGQQDQEEKAEPARHAMRSNPV